jgi:hypothetical protein
VRAASTLLEEAEDDEEKVDFLKEAKSEVIDRQKELKEAKEVLAEFEAKIYEA